MKPIIIFDLDGTLVDTAPDLMAALNHALAHAGMPAVDPLTHRRHLGFGGKVMIERAFEARGRALAPEELARLLDIFLAHYTANIPGATSLFPGAHALMDRLSGSGFLLAVCTNKLERLAIALMNGLGVSDRFAAICGQDTFAFRKPDPRHLTETIRLAGGDPEQAIMVGDSHTDIDTAKAAGIPVVAVDYGYTDRPVRDFQPSRIISHFDQLTLDMARDLIESARG